MRKIVFFVQVQYSVEDFEDTVTERIYNIPDYSAYFPTYEKAQEYLEKFIDPDIEKYKQFPHREYSIHKAWIDDDY